MPDTNEENKKLIEDYYSYFKRNGAELSTENKDKLKKIDEELSLLSPKFSKNVFLISKI